MHTVAFLLTFISSAFAYTVVNPNSNQGWTNHGAQLLTWQRVDSDRQNFTVVLVNQNVTGFQPKVLATALDGTKGSAPINPPSDGWPTPGGGYRVNLVQDANDLSAILAQSNQFNITEGASTLSSSATSGSATRSATGSATGSGSSSTATSASKSSSAVRSGFTVSSLLAFVLVVGIALS